LQKLHFDKDLFEPFVVVPNRNALACEAAELHAVQNVLYKKHNTLASPPKLSFYDEEGLEVVGAERFRRNMSWWNWRTAHKLSSGWRMKITWPVS
jgi:hypothetical protein